MADQYEGFSRKDLIKMLEEAKKEKADFSEAIAGELKNLHLQLAERADLYQSFIFDTGLWDDLRDWIQYEGLDDKCLKPQ